MTRKIAAVVGTYRRGRVIETAVDELLGGARQQGAETEKIMLLDEHIEFCTNCRLCTQEASEKRGSCPLKDDMAGVLQRLDEADGIVLASPINAGNVTAIMKRFAERCLCYTYWPWDAKTAPQRRIQRPSKQAVVITSSMCPAWIGRWLMGNAARTLKGIAKFLGASKTETLYFGFVAIHRNETLSERNRELARKQGMRLARSI